MIQLPRLLDYANSKSKIPNSTLNHAYLAPISRQQIIKAYLTDFAMIFYLIFFIPALMHFGLLGFMTTPELQYAYLDLNFLPQIIALGPILAFCYYAFSFYYNQGQTWGMLTQKIRIQMGDHQLAESLKWAAVNALGLMSFGLLFPILNRWTKNRGWRGLVHHDYLHFDLMTKTPAAPVQLTQLTSKATTAPEKENFQQAA